MITTLQRPLSTNLTTLAAVKEELKLQADDSSDAYLGRLIQRASASVEQYVNRTFARAQVQESIAGFGDVIAMLSRTPLIPPLGQILFDNSVVTDVTIDDPVLGTLYRRQGWDWTVQWARGFLQPEPIPSSEERRYLVTYWAGYIMPADDVVSSALAATGATRTVSVTGAVMPLVSAGDIITLGGFLNPNNLGPKTVVSRTASAIVVAEALADEAPVEALRTLTARTLPFDIEQATIESVKAWNASRARDPAITEREVGNLRVSYRTGMSVAGTPEVPQPLPPVAMALLAGWVRLR